MTRAATLERPRFPLPQLETPRALMELASLPGARPWLRHAPKGDGHTVMTLPGFMANDRSMAPLRRYLAKQGYAVEPWSLGRNLGPLAIGEEGERLSERVQEIYEKTGEKISLIGWSLGGVMAREIAKMAPDMIRQVITLGSPFAGGPKSSNVGRLYRRVTKQDTSTPEFKERMKDIALAPQHTPTTAIFTKTDGVVHWRGCIESPGPLTDNIELRASHCGIGVNPVAFYAIAERLSQGEHDWQPFDRTAQTWRRVAYPSSGHVYGL